MGVPQGAGFFQKATVAEVAQVRGTGMGEDTVRVGCPLRSLDFMLIGPEIFERYKQRHGFILFKLKKSFRKFGLELRGDVGARGICPYKVSVLAAGVGQLIPAQGVG